MTPGLSTGLLYITAAVATLAPAVRTSAVAPVMTILRPILIMFFPPMTARDARYVTPARMAATPEVLSSSPPLLLIRRDEDGDGLPPAVTVIRLCHPTYRSRPV